MSGCVEFPLKTQSRGLCDLYQESLLGHFLWPGRQGVRGSLIAMILLIIQEQKLSTVP